MFLLNPLKKAMVMTILMSKGKCPIPSEIECVIKTYCPSGVLKMINVDDLEITDHHPIMKDFLENGISY